MFTATQRWWLDRMVDVIASSAGVTVDDLDQAFPSMKRGEVDGAYGLGDGAADYLETLNSERRRDWLADTAIGRGGRVRLGQQRSPRGHSGSQMRPISERRTLAGTVSSSRM